MKPQALCLWLTISAWEACVWDLRKNSIDFSAKSLESRWRYGSLGGMSAKIKILSSQLVDQIAAGEVVERPASVVKELIENSLDAGAERIECRVEQAGSKLIQVTDDAMGMSREDVELAVRRHATSKISSAEDLDRILTLGFRGEALASIAAVSKMRITTRRKEDSAATLLVMEAGRLLESTDTAAPVGTEILVEDLFYNVPARRKFLRSQSTEIGHIQTWLMRLCLARHQVNIRLVHANRNLVNAPATEDLGQRAAILLGRDVYAHLYPFDYQEEDVRIKGLLSDPTHTRTNPRGILFFVNGRYVQDRMLQHALMDACHGVVPQGRYPTTVMKIEIDPKMVDVNVHPQKTEVRFVRTQHIYRAVGVAVAQLLSVSPWMKTSRTYFLKTQQAQLSEAKNSPDRIAVHRSILQPIHKSTSRPKWWDVEKKFEIRATHCESVDSAAEDLEVGLDGMHLLGILWNSYILLSDSTRVIIIDQHAAAERIAYEHMLASLKAGNIASQRLLVPLQLELDAPAVSMLESQIERTRQVGFELELFGNNTIIIKAIPALLSHVRVESLVKDTLDELAELDLSQPWERERQKVIGRMACHAAIRSGRPLSDPEVHSLLMQLDKVDHAGSCPHGRPVLVDFDRDEVAHWFHRK